MKSGRGSLELGLLGELEVRSAGCVLPLPASRKARALLGFLVATCQPHLRTRLCDLLWDGPDNPRAELRWSLSKIRPLLNLGDEQRLVADREHVTFNLRNAVSDLVAVRGLLAAGVARVSNENLEKAVDLFRSEFLNGLDLPACPQFQLWCLGERLAAKSMRLAALNELIHRSKNAPEQTLRHAQAIAAIEPLSETTHASIVGLLISLGREKEASDHYHIARKALATEFGTFELPVLDAAFSAGRRRRSQSAVADARAARRHGRGRPSARSATVAGDASWEKASIAVLPFTNLTGDPEQDHLADGITDDLIAELSRFGDFSVIARNSTFAFKGSKHSPSHVSRLLSAQFLLEGSIRKSDDRLRMVVNLSDGFSERQIWAERYELSVDDLFSTQDEITRRIVGSLAPQITYAARERELTHGGIAKHQSSLRASGLIWRGWDQTDVDMISRGIALAEYVLEGDPNCERALAICALGRQARAELRPKGAAADLEVAASSAERLHSLDPDNQTVWLVRGIVSIRRQQHAEALACLRRSHLLNPNDVLTLRYLSSEESNWGLGSDAIAHGKRALQLSPRDPGLDWIYWVLSFASYVEGNLEAAVKFGRESVFLNPRNAGHYGFLAASLAEQGELAEAQEVIKAAFRRGPDYVCSRLAGKTYFAVPELAARYVTALKRAAGDLQRLWLRA